MSFPNFDYKFRFKYLLTFAVWCDGTAKAEKLLSALPFPTTLRQWGLRVCAIGFPTE